MSETTPGCIGRPRLHRLLANVGTRDVAKGMDVLRSALGDERLNYLGFSYGTRIGYTYAETFPGNVRAMVLDGADDPNADPAAADVAQEAAFQAAFDVFAEWCAQQTQCPSGNDPKSATADFQRLLAPHAARGQLYDRRFDGTYSGSRDALMSIRCVDEKPNTDGAPAAPA